MSISDIFSSLPNVCLLQASPPPPLPHHLLPPEELFGGFLFQRLSLELS